MMVFSFNKPLFDLTSFGFIVIRDYNAFILRIVSRLVDSVLMRKPNVVIHELARWFHMANPPVFDCIIYAINCYRYKIILIVVNKIIFFL